MERIFRSSQAMLGLWHTLPPFVWISALLCGDINSVEENVCDGSVSITGKVARNICILLFNVLGFTVQILEAEAATGTSC